MIALGTSILAIGFTLAFFAVQAQTPGGSRRQGPEAATRMKAFYDALAPAQRPLFDRRVLLSQSEPLGPP